MTDTDIADLRATLAALQLAIQQEFTALKEEIKELSAFREQLRGAWKTLVIMGAVVGAVITLIAERVLR